MGSRTLKESLNAVSPPTVCTISDPRGIDRKPLPETQGGVKTKAELPVSIIPERVWPPVLMFT